MTTLATRRVFAPEVIGYRVVNKQGERWFVSEKPGEGGVDWGYVLTAAEAKPLSTYWARRFAADMRRVGDTARFIPASQPGIGAAR